jgi:3-hydroxyacyl-[acyl-carrier-protein] dehydratase
MNNTTIPSAYREPYRLIDEVVDHRKAAGITCRTRIRGDEPYLSGHFPGQPIVPGVLEIEMLFQAAELFLVMEQRAAGSGRTRLAAVKSARFTNPIIPPRDLTVTVDLKQDGQTQTDFSGRVSDGPDLFVQASFSVTIV